MDIISKSRTQKRIKLFSTSLKKHMIKGFTMLESIERVCKKTEPFVLASVSAGEKSGTLAQAFQHLYKYLERKNKLDQKFRNTSSYPILILIVAISLASVLIGFMVPLIQEIAQTLETDLPHNTLRLINFATWCSSYRWIILFFSVLILAISIFLYYKLTFFIHSMWLRFPIIGDWIRKKDLWKFFSTFSLMLKNQVPADKALLIATETISNLRLYEEISLTIAPVLQGVPLSGTLRRFMLSSEYIYSLLKTGEESNQVAQNADFISEALQNELYSWYEQWVKLTEPAIFIIIGMVVLWIVFSAYLPMISLFQWEMWGVP